MSVAFNFLLFAFMRTRRSEVGKRGGGIGKGPQTGIQTRDARSITALYVSALPRASCFLKNFNFYTQRTNQKTLEAEQGLHAFVYRSRLPWQLFYLKGNMVKEFFRNHVSRFMRSLAFSVSACMFPVNK